MASHYAQNDLYGATGQHGGMSAIPARSRLSLALFPLHPHGIYGACFSISCAVELTPAPMGCFPPWRQGRLACHLVVAANFQDVVTERSRSPRSGKTTIMVGCTKPSMPS